jgi:hypothetical protein
MNAASQHAHQLTIAIRLAHRGVDRPDNLTGTVGHSESLPAPAAAARVSFCTFRGMWARAAARN